MELMELRGPILVVTSISLLVSAGFIRYFQQQAELVPTDIETVSAQLADCDSRGLDTPFGRLGCDAEAQQQNVWEKRTTAGGALFISGGSAGN